MNYMEKDNVTTKQLLLLLIVAYMFSFIVRLIWVYQFHDYTPFYWDDQLMINTNDGYYFASWVQAIVEHLHLDNPRVEDSLFKYGVVAVTVFVVKLGISIDTAILYMPAVISSIVVVPIILLANLYKKPLWGFFAALLGSIGWSYYNRTMTGYYDTDMFAAMAPMFVLYFLMKSTIDFNLKTAFYASLFIIIYPFLYDQGQTIVYAMGIMYALYMVFFHRNEKLTYASLILVFLALIPLGLSKPETYIVHIILVSAVYFFLKQERLEFKQLVFSAAVFFVTFLFLGDVFSLVYAKIMSYTVTGTGAQSGALHFFQVNQTVREAGHIPFSTFANRIIGSEIGVVLSLVGYILLVIKHRAFILALPLVGIGVFALFGGLRFTVYAVPIAAMSAVYLFVYIAEYIKQERLRYAFIALATAAMLYPNIKHIVGYKIPTVLNNQEVKDLVALDKMADGKDYTLAWWDYGYPIWYYSDTSTLIDGGKHQNDNFIISQIMTTTSPTQAANLARLSVETYVSSNYKVVANQIFKDKNPNEFLKELASSSYTPPKKTRDIYLYMPFKMLNIFPTIGLFSNLDLTTGKKKRMPFFSQTAIVKQVGNSIMLANGMEVNLRLGKIKAGAKVATLSHADVAILQKDGSVKVQEQRYMINGAMSIVYMKSYNKVIIMDTQTYNSMYVKMFMLGKYDKNLFEPVVISPFTRIYKLKK